MRTFRSKGVTAVVVFVGAIGIGLVGAGPAGALFEPETTITDAPTSPNNSTSASFTFESSIAGSTFECQLDGGGFAGCTSPHTYSSLSPGQHTFEVIATDPLFPPTTDPTPATHTWTIDTSAPDATITSGPASPTASTNGSFAFSSSDPTATFECQLDGGGFSTCTDPKSYSGLSSATHTFQVRAVDDAGNRGPVDSFTWTVDTVAPTATITSGPANPTSATSASFSFTSNDSNATFECQIDGGGFSACTSPEAYSGLSAATHTFQVRATDGAGNTGSADTHTWTIDTTAPTATITGTPPNPSTSTGASFSFTSNDSNATFECQLDGGGFSSCTTPEVYSGLAANTHTFQVRARDGAGNIGAADSYTWTIDNAAPTATITNAPPNPTSSTSASFSFTSDDSNASFECKLDGAAFSACTDPAIYLGLSATTHTFQVRAKDGAGNTGAADTYTWTIDNTAPAATITNTPPNPSGSTSASFSFTSSDSGATFECQLDGGGFSPCASPASYSGLAATSHTFEVRATDGVGNTGSPDSYTWTIDTTAPGVSITNGPANPTSATSASFSFSSPDPTASFQCQLDGGGFTGCTSPKSYSGLAATGHTFQVRATDTAGNVSSPDSYNWTIDNSAPTATITGSPPNPSGSTSASFSFTANDAGATFECQLDGGGFSACTDPAVYLGLSATSHNFQVRAKDGAGNTGAADTYTWTIDTTAPTATITNTPPNPSGSTSASFSFTSNDAGASFECQLDGGGFSACTDPKSYSGLAGTSHTFQVRAMDGVGNTGAADSYTWTIDTTAPDVTIISGPANPTGATSASFSFSSSDPTASFACQLDGGGFTSCTSPKSYSGLPATTHTFQVRATDNSGNVSSPISYTWTIDTVAPDVSITSGPSGTTNSTAVHFEFSSLDSGASFQCERESGGFQACASPQDYTVGEGSHTFRVRATDGAGNIGPAVVRTWAVDTTPPVTSLISGPPTISPSPNASFSFSSSESGSFQCHLDGANWEPCSSPKAYSGISPGTHTFYVRAVDQGLNVDASEETHTWTIDTAPPTATITSFPPNPSASPSASFSFASDDAGATFECQLDGGGFAACPNPKTYSGLSAATHTFEVHAKDAAGNTSAAASYTWAIDTSAPNTSITNGPPQDGTINSATVSFDFTSTEPGSTFVCSIDGPDYPLDYVSCTSPAIYSNLSEGRHTFRARAVDSVGNVDASPATRVFFVDTTPPDTTITVGPTDTTADDTPTFEFTATGGGVAFECRIDAEAFAPCTSPQTMSPLTNSSHTFEVRARDAAGNLDPSPASRTFTVNTLVPDTLITLAPGQFTNQTSVEFRFASDESPVTFECTLTGPVNQVDGNCISPKQYSSLTPGAYTFSVRASDPQGNTDQTPATRTFTVDTGAPQTFIDSGPTGTVNSNTATFAIRSSEAGSSFECQLDSQPATVCNSPVVYGPLADGSHTFLVRATDQAGNRDQTVASRNWSVDTVPPTVTITRDSQSLPNDNTPTFILSSPDATSFECQLDDPAAPFTACSSTYTTPTLADGAHNLRVQARDAAGNVSVPTVHSFTVDATSPTVTITSAPPPVTNSTTATFQFTADEAGSTFQCRVTQISPDYQPCSSPQTYTGLTNGSYTFQVQATDPAGNTSTFTPAPPKSKSHHWTVNTNLPQTTIDSAPQQATNSTAARFTFSSPNEPGANFQCSVDGLPYANCNSPKDYTNLTPGDHVFGVKAINPAGTQDPDPAVFNWTVDTSPPDTTIGSGPPATTSSGFASFSFSSESGASFECRLDGGPWAACTSPRIYGELVLGQHSFQVRAVDQAGNRDHSPASRSWSVVALAPPVAPATAASGPALISPFPVIRIAGSITKAGVRLRLFLVNAPAGAKVTVRCSGKRCPFKKKSRAASNLNSTEPQARVAKALRMRTIENRFYPAGVKIEVFVTKPGMIGKYTRFKIRKAKAPARVDRCLMPGSNKPVRCAS